MHFETLGMNIIRDGDNLFLGDDSSVESVFKSNNFGWGTTVNWFLVKMSKIVSIGILNVQMNISRNYNAILNVLESEMMFFAFILVWIGLNLKGQLVH